MTPTELASRINAARISLVHDGYDVVILDAKAWERPLSPGYQWAVARVYLRRYSNRVGGCGRLGFIQLAGDDLEWCEVPPEVRSTIEAILRPGR